MKYKKELKKFWNYLWYDDSLGSYILNFIVAFIVIKFIFFPVIGFALNNDYPIVAIVSGSMEHKIVDNRVCNVHFAQINYKKLSTEEWWGYCGKYYEANYNLTLDEFKEFNYKNGLNIGDVMVLYGKSYENINVGDMLVFIPEDREFFNTKGPVIHRVILKWQDEEGKYHFRTKGDHNPQSFENFEQNIPQDDVIGVAVVRIPFIGYAKLLFNKLLSNSISIT